jgi:hypothetical protein
VVVTAEPAAPVVVVAATLPGSSGNGPSDVTGPVRVAGTDVYGLDADKDGLGCE